MLEACAIAFLLIATLSLSALLLITLMYPRSRALHVMTLHKSCDAVCTIEPEVQSMLVTKKAELVDLRLIPIQGITSSSLLVVVLYRR